MIVRTNCRVINWAVGETAQVCECTCRKTESTLPYQGHQHQHPLVSMALGQQQMVNKHEGEKKKKPLTSFYAFLNLEVFRPVDSLCHPSTSCSGQGQKVKEDFSVQNLFRYIRDLVNFWKAPRNILEKNFQIQVPNTLHYFCLWAELWSLEFTSPYQGDKQRQNTIHAHTDTFGQFKVSNQPTPPMSMFSGTLKKTQGEHVKQMLFCHPPQITPPTRSGPEASGLTHLHSIITFAVWNWFHVSVALRSANTECGTM